MTKTIKIFVEGGIVTEVWANRDTIGSVEVHDADGDERDEVRALAKSMEKQTSLEQVYP